MKGRSNKKILWGVGGMAAALLLLTVFVKVDANPMRHTMEIRREKFIEEKNDMIFEMLAQGKYSCCLETPCTYCIEKSPGHGEGATCNCLKDVMEGVHPCGECIGEILEGHGNPYIAKYFAKAISEKTGQEDAIKLIIEEKYEVPVSEQV